MQIVTTAQMKEIEKNSLSYGLSYQRLMENAGCAASTFIRKTIDIKGRNCMVFCGKGNNGGDGLVVARKLLENGANIIVVLIDGVPTTNESYSMYDMNKKIGITTLDFEYDFVKVMSHLSSTDIVIDAIFGTGFHGELSSTHKKACDSINSAISAVFSLDIPSGVDGDSGKFDPNCVCADFTIVFDSLKPAHALDTSVSLCGKVQIVDIGIPPEAKSEIISSLSFIEPKYIFDFLSPRDENANKGDFGKLLIISGCAYYPGAPWLASLSAMRCGAGLVRLASTEYVCSKVNVSEAVMLPLPQTKEGFIHRDARNILLSFARQSTAVLIGCGLGQCDDTNIILEDIIKNVTCPIIIDADGINLVCRNINILKEAIGDVILTPHLGEMARLCNTTIDYIKSDRYRIARDFAIEHSVTLLLKGKNTIIATPDGCVYINTTGNPGLAKAGAGDILAGMISSFAAQGIPPDKAASAGAYLHGLAADMAAKRLSQYAMLPHEILTDLTQIFLENNL